MGAVLATLLAAWASLFPERWRRRLGLEHHLPIDTLTWITGLLEIALGAALGYLASMAYQGTRGLSDAGVALVGMEPLVRAMFQTPLGLAVPFLCVEGAVRAFAGLTGAPCGVLLLWLLDRLAYGGERTIDRALSQPPLADAVDRLPDGAGYRVWSTHDHRWDELTTIEIHGQLWRVVESLHDAPAPRTHAWTLAPVGAGWVSRGLPVRYDPRGHIKAEKARQKEAAQAARSIAAELAGALPRPTLGAGLALVIAPVVSLLPERTRARWRLDGVPIVLFTFLTGLVEAAVGTALWLELTSTWGLWSAPALVAALLIAEGLARAGAGFAGYPCGTIAAWAIERAIMGPARALGRRSSVPPAG